MIKKISKTHILIMMKGKNYMHCILHILVVRLST
jgi:hypothetical protein